MLCFFFFIKYPFKLGIAFDYLSKVSCEHHFMLPSTSKFDHVTDYNITDMSEGGLTGY